MIENEYYDLVGPREYAKVRSETKGLKRASGPGVGWIWRDGKLTNHAEADIQKAVKGAPGLIWRLVRRIALNDPTLEVKDNSTKPNRLEFYDASTLLCWIDIDASGAPVLWGAPDVDRVSGPPDVEWVWGPLKTFGNLRIPAWGAYTNGEFRLEMLEVQGSPKPFSKSLEPPTPTGTEDADETQSSNPRYLF